MIQTDINDVSIGIVLAYHCILSIIEEMNQTTLQTIHIISGVFYSLPTLVLQCTHKYFATLVDAKLFSYQDQVSAGTVM